MAIVQHKYGTLSELLEHPQNENVISISTDIGSIWKGSTHLTDRVIDASVVDGSLNIKKITKDGSVNVEAVQLKFNFIEELEEFEDSSALAVGDTYDTAFSKLNKIIEDNEYVTAAALTDHERRLRQTNRDVSALQELLEGGNLDVNANVEYYLTLQIFSAHKIQVTAHGIKDLSESSVSWQDLWDRGYRLCILYKGQNSASGKKKWKLYNLPAVWNALVNDSYPWDDITKVKIFTPQPIDNDNGIFSGVLGYDPFYTGGDNSELDLISDLIFYQDKRIMPGDSNITADALSEYDYYSMPPLGPPSGFTKWYWETQTSINNPPPTSASYIQYFNNNWQDTYSENGLITYDRNRAPFWYFGKAKNFPRFEAYIDPVGNTQFRERFCTVNFGIGLFKFTDVIDETTQCISSGNFYLNRLVSNITEFKMVRKKWGQSGWGWHCTIYP